MMLPTNTLWKSAQGTSKYVISDLPFPLLHRHWQLLCWEEVFVALVLFLTHSLKSFAWTADYYSPKGWPLTLCCFQSYV